MHCCYGAQSSPLMSQHPASWTQSTSLRYARSILKHSLQTCPYKHTIWNTVLMLPHACYSSRQSQSHSYFNYSNDTHIRIKRQKPTTNIDGFETQLRSNYGNTTTEFSLLEGLYFESRLPCVMAACDMEMTLQRTQNNTISSSCTPHCVKSFSC